ncbi:MAG: glycosyltransferase [Roseovarius sp.]
MPDDRIPLPCSPRNAWGQIAEALRLGSLGEATAARRHLDGIRFHPDIDPGLFEMFHRHVEARIPPGHRLPKVNMPADFTANPTGLLRVPFRAVEADRYVPRPYPSDLALPELAGHGNDTYFLHTAAAGLAPLSQDAITRIHVFCGAENDGQAERLLTQIDRQQSDAPLKVTLFTPSRGPTLDAAITASPHKVDLLEAPLLSPRAAQYMTEALPQADLFLFLSGEVTLDPGALARAAYLGRVSDTVVQPLLQMPEMRLPTPYAVKSSPHPFGHDLPFRHVDGLNLMVPRALLQRAGGPDTNFTSPTHAAREMAFRFFNLGAYFSPLLVPLLRPARTSGNTAADNRLLTDLCPDHLDRPKDGRYRVPKVSVYIPAFNAGKYIERAVESVLEQDMQDLEICIANDGSQDKTLDILERAFGSDPRVRWQDGENGGIGHASNHAVRMTRGLYVGQLDADDVLKPGALRQLADYLDAHPRTVCCYSSAERIDADGNHIKNEYSWPVFSREKMMITSIAHHFRMFRRAAWERTTGFRTDIRNAVDYDMFLKLSETGAFHHIDRILYQRRWHGRNTSFLHERSQTANTYRVQTEALKRQGLDRHWEVHLPNPDEPRWVSFRCKAQKPRVFFYPNYDRANPYQNLLYRKASRDHEIVEAPIASALRTLRQANGAQRIIFHLHWVNFLFKDVRLLGQARRNVSAFLKDLAAFKHEGGRIVWTVHNVISHDAAFPDLEADLARRIAELADVIHLHSAASLPEVRAAFYIPPEKVRISPHGNYFGIYPDFVTRDTARETLGLAPDDDVILFAGQVRPYKGVGRLVTAFRQLLAERPKAKLVIAGAMHHKVLRKIKPSLSRAERDRILATNRFLDEPELQLFFRAADLAVFPYSRILTSGSLVLALSFGLPTIVPRVGMTAEVLDGTDAGIVYDPEDDGALPGALRSLLARKDAGTIGQMADAALARAREQHWPDLGETLYADL